MKNGRFLLPVVLTVGMLASSLPVKADGLAPLRPANETGTYSSSGYTTSPGTESYYSGEPLKGQVTVIPKGTMLMVKLDQPISSFSTNLGDPINATLENDVFVNDAVVLPAGSELQGQVANVNPSGRLGKHGDIDIRFVAAKLPNGSTVPLRAHIVTSDESGVLKGSSYTADVAKGVGTAVGGTALGAGMGVAAGSLMGSVVGGVLFGTAVGGIAGTSYALMRKGKDVVLPSGSRLSVMLEQPVSLTPN